MKLRSLIGFSRKILVTPIMVVWVHPVRTDNLATAENADYIADKVSDEYKETGEKQAEQFMDVD